jgi:thiol-disulfide isomerase/thioredoxin
MDDYASVYDGGQMTDVHIEKQQIITYTKEEAIEDLTNEGSYATQGSPFGILQDTSWILVKKEENVFIYELAANRDTTEDGRTYTIERIMIDDKRHLLVAWERIYTLNEKPMQHLIRAYSDYLFDQHESLDFTFPEGFSTVSNKDREKMREAGTLTIGQRFPSFSLSDIEGRLFATDDLNGKKGLYVFSFIGCGGCEYTRQELAKMQFELDEDYVGLYLNPLNTADQLRNYHADKPWPFPMATVDYEFSERYGVYSYPTFITVDEHGMVEEVRSGYDEDFFLRKAKRD